MSDITTTTECTIEDYRQMLHWERENLEHQQKYSRSLENKAQKLEQQLAIAVEALKEYGNCENWNNIYDSESADFEPLYWANKWKDEYGYKYAQEKLKQIEELNK